MVQTIFLFQNNVARETIPMMLTTYREHVLHGTSSSMDW